MKHKNVAFMNYGKNYGYWVRVSRYGYKRQKYFPIKEYVSRIACLEQALIWRDKTIKKLESKELSLEKILKRKTGMQNRPVARVKKRIADSGHHRYICIFRYGDKAYYKSFNSGWYGKDEAKRKAEHYANQINKTLNLKELNQSQVDNKLQIHLREMGVVKGNGDEI